MMQANQPLLPGYLRLLWKEYRVQRGFWLAMLAVALIAQAAVISPWLGNVDERTASMALFLFAFLSSAFYCLGCAATIYAGERELRTLDRLRLYRVTPKTILASKLGFCVLSTASLLFILYSMARIFTSVVPPLSEWMPFTAFMLEFMVWGLFFSLVCHRPLTAVVLAALATVFATIVATRTRFLFEDPLPATQSDRLSDVAQGVAEVFNYQLAIIGVVLLFDVWLALRIWKEPTSRPVVVKRPRMHSFRVFGRLVWAEFRQSRWTMLSLATAGMLAVPLCLRGTSLQFNFGLSPEGVTAVIAALMGASVFRAEKEDRRHRFLANRGIDPRLVWRAKHFVWLPVALLGVAAILSLSDWLKDLFGLWSGKRLVDWSGAYHVALLGYSAGQLASLSIRNGLIAGLIALLALGASAFWCAVVEYAAVSPLLFVAPLALLLLVGSRFGMTDWLLDRCDGRAGVFRLAMVAVPVLLFVSAFAFWRVHEIAPTGLGFDEAVLYAPPTSEEKGTADLYRLAMQPLTETSHALTAKVSAWLAFPVASKWSEVSNEQKQWLAMNTGSLSFVRQAAARPSCRFIPYAERSIQTQADLTRLRSLAVLLVLNARKLEAENRLREAFDEYSAGLALCRHLSTGASFDEWLLANAIERQLLESIHLWSEHAEQSPAILQNAMTVLSSNSALTPSLEDVARTYFAQRARLLTVAIPTPWNAETQEDHPASIGTILALAPWERARERRLLRQATAQRVAVARELEDAIKRTTSFWEQMQHPAMQDPASDLRRWFWTTRSLQRIDDPFFRTAPKQIYDRQTLRNGAILRLALYASQLARGRLPEKLDDLKGQYLAEIPRDPYTGQAFHYQPTGFPHPVLFGQDGEELMVPLQQPLFWSVGSGAAMLRPVYATKASGAGENSLDVPKQPSTALRLVSAYANPTPAGLGWAFLLKPDAR